MNNPTADAGHLTFFDGEPPRRNDVQYIAFAIDLNGLGHNQPSPEPRWCVVRWGNTVLGDRHPFWEWSVPGRSTQVSILKWAQLPHLDFVAKHNLEMVDGR